MNLRVKIGIAVGCVIFYHIANDNERHFGEAGQTIEEVNIAQSSASSGTVVVCYLLTLLRAARVVELLWYVIC